MTPAAMCMFAGAVGVLSWALTGAVRWYALRAGLIDVPGDRSSHLAPTPRGGGAAIVVVTLLACALLIVFEEDDSLPAIALAGAIVVAVLGFIDDHGHLAPTARLAGHFAAGALAVWSIGGAPPLPVLGQVIHLGSLGFLVSVIFVVWMINLTNFMDGIDGLAGAQVVIVCAIGAALSFVATPWARLWREPMLLAAATAGFLLWNWPPARIFMGDVGSGFVGFMIAVFSIRTTGDAPQVLWAWLILSAVFVSDATVTLLERAARGENVTSAHRSHAYQQLAATWGSHRAVTLLVLCVNVLYLAPLALAVTIRLLDGVIAAVLAYAPIAAAVLRVRLGHIRLMSERN